MDEVKKKRRIMGIKARKTHTQTSMHTYQFYVLAKRKAFDRTKTPKRNGLHTRNKKWRKQQQQQQKGKKNTCGKSSHARQKYQSTFVKQSVKMKRARTVAKQFYLFRSFWSNSEMYLN